MLYITNKIVGN